jgi:hypothetical protein
LTARLQRATRGDRGARCLVRQLQCTGGMRTAAVLLLISVAGCSVPSYSLRSSSSTPLLASNDVAASPPPPPPGMVEVPASEVARRPIVLVPAVRSGHSATWKAGAAVTVVSLAVSLAGVGLTLGGLQGINIDGGQSHNNGGMFLAGIVISAIGDGGLFLGGPITWMAGIGGPRD